MLQSNAVLNFPKPVYGPPKPVYGVPDGIRYPPPPPDIPPPAGGGGYYKEITIPIKYGPPKLSIPQSHGGGLGGLGNALSGLSGGFGGLGGGLEGLGFPSKSNLINPLQSKLNFFDSISSKFNGFLGNGGFGGKFGGGAPKPVYGPPGHIPGPLYGPPKSPAPVYGPPPPQGLAPAYGPPQPPVYQPNIAYGSPAQSYAPAFTGKLFEPNLVGHSFNAQLEVKQQGIPSTPLIKCDGWKPILGPVGGNNDLGGFADFNSGGHHDHGHTEQTEIITGTGQGLESDDFNVIKSEGIEVSFRNISLY